MSTDRRTITFMRTKTLFNSSKPWDIYIDGDLRGHICGGETKKFQVDHGSHEIYVRNDDPNIIQFHGIEIDEGTIDRIFKTEIGYGYANGLFGCVLKLKDITR